MPQRTINARELAKDIKLGADNAFLMQKYQISPRELKAVFKKMVEMGVIEQGTLLRRDAARKRSSLRTTVRKRGSRIDAREFAEDIQLGLDDHNLMLKYDLSAQQLEKVLRQLVDSGLFTEGELYDRSVAADTVTTDTIAEAQEMIDELD
jgi:hypothetical protein